MDEVVLEFLYDALEKVKGVVNSLEEAINQEKMGRTQGADDFMDQARREVIDAAEFLKTIPETVIDI